MTKLVNRAKMTTATTGTGTITLGSAVDGYQTFADAGVANADVVRYVIEDGDAWEIGLGTYTASGTTLTRGSIESSNADAALNLTGNAVVYVSAAAADLQELVDFADNFVLPTADGSTGQVLQTNGAGTLSFTTISGYTDSDVDTHLNTGTASSGEVLSWTGSDYDWITAGGSFSTIGTRNLAAIATLPDLTTGTDNFVAGDSAGANITSGSRNIAIGRLAQVTATTASDNVFLGNTAGYYATSGSNIGIGFNALEGNSVSNMTGGSNIGIGYQTGVDLSTGTYNFLGGYQAGTNLTTGSNNVALGSGALDAATTGGRNIAIGQDAMGLGVATAASGDNVAIGYQAGNDLTSGTDNLLLGYQAGANLTTSASNIAIGETAMRDGNGGSGYNVAIGRLAGQNLSGSALRNVTIGEEAGANSNGAYNIGIGYNATKGASAGAFTGGYNIGVGEYPLAVLTTGSDNIGIGRRAGFDITSGANNFLGGYQAGTNLTTGSNNVALGNGALDAATTGGTNVAIGQNAMGAGAATAATGYNVAIGITAGNAITSGVANTFLSDSAGAATTTGSYNVAIGQRALDANTSGIDNIAIGRDAVGNVTSNEGLVGVGFEALKDATGSYNTAIGYGAATTLTSGSNNSIVGNGAQTSSATVSNEITLGNSSITRFRIPGIQSGASDGDVLTYDATNGILSLQAAGGGGFTLISETTTSIASFVDVTFPAGYKVYMLVLKDVSVGDNVDMIIRRSNSSNAPMSGATDYGYSAHTTSTTVESSTGDSKWLISPQAAPAYGEFYGNGDGYSGVITFTGVRESTDYMTGVGELIYRGASTYENLKVRLVAMSAEQNNGIRILENGGGLVRAGGSILLYGLA